MPRFAYWTILVDGQPTAFRAKDAADLQPTLKRIQRTEPSAVLKWFERGRLWSSPAEAAAARRKPSVRRPIATRPGQAKTWRPGGLHRDPNARPKPPRAIRKRRILQRLRTRQAPRRKKGS